MKKKLAILRSKIHRRSLNLTLLLVVIIIHYDAQFTVIEYDLVFHR
jgi:hypothetical protein